MKFNLMFLIFLLFTVSCSSLKQERKISSIDGVSFFTEGKEPNFKPCDDQSSAFLVKEAQFFGNDAVVIDCAKDSNFHMYKNDYSDGLRFVSDIAKNQPEAGFIELNSNENFVHSVALFSGIDSRAVTFFYSSSDKCSKGLKLLNFVIATQERNKIKTSNVYSTDICVSAEPKWATEKNVQVNVIAINKSQEKNVIGTVAIYSDSEIVGLTISNDGSFVKNFDLKGDNFFPKKCGDGFIGGFFYPNSTKFAMFYANPRVMQLDYSINKVQEIYNATSNTGGGCVGYEPTIKFQESGNIQFTGSGFVWTNFSRKENKFVATSFKF